MERNIIKALNIQLCTWLTLLWLPFITSFQSVDQYIHPALNSCEAQLTPFQTKKTFPAFRNRCSDPKAPASLPLRRNIYTIPVAIHIISGTDGQSSLFPADQKIAEGVEWINNLLSGGPACADDPLSVETNIRLCLATRDRNGSPTSGITRWEHSLTDMDLCHQDVDLKSLVRDNGDLFPDTSYLNIYIVREICASCQPGDCLAGGYAAFPAAHGTPVDGIVLEAITWMNRDCHLRKVILHELGHYFNLQHTWAGNPCENENCLVDGDGICDTPPDADANFYASNPCIESIPVNTCFSDVYPADPNNPFTMDQQDMTSNLMDYAPPACIAVFTPGQVERMQSAIEGPRKSLLRSKGCDEPCRDPIMLQIDWPDGPILFGTPVLLEAAAQGATSVRWQWYGGLTNDENLLFPADSTGKFEICIEAFGDSPSCDEKTCQIVEVVCSLAPPAISLSDYQIDPLQTVTFTHTSPPQAGYTYTWFINGESYGQGASIPYTPQIAGSVSIRIEACRQGCCLESEHAYLSVGTCPTGKEGNHWLFGIDAIHLDWNSGVPIEQPQAAGNFFEASAIATDPNGALLFYSNNSRVYNRNHALMPNSTLITATPRPGTSATHCITVPLPGSDSLWYIFHPDAYISFDPGLDTTGALYFSIVDMSLNNGLGGVVMKNQLLLLPSTEKVAAVRHCNGVDWWIVGHEATPQGSNRFFSFLLSSAGISTPVISASGSFKSRIKSTKAGEMNFSPNGLKLAMAMEADWDIENPTRSTIELFDFDPASGIVSNGFIVDEFIANTSQLGTAYSVEFSPNNDFLYITRSRPNRDSLFQYDLRSDDPGTISGSKLDIYQSANPSDDNLGGMITGPDDRIYITNFVESHISVIHNPDRRGIACGFESHGIDLVRGRAGLGLPTFPANINHPGKPYLIGPYVICDTVQEAKYYVAGNCSYQDYEWRIDGNSKVVRTQGDTVWIKPGKPGLDVLHVTKFTACGSKQDSFEIEVTGCKQSHDPCTLDVTISEADTIICQGEDAYIQFYSSAQSVLFSRSGDGVTRSLTSPVLVIPAPMTDETVTLFLTGDGGCDTTIRIGIHVNAPLEASILRADTVICNGENVQLDIRHRAGCLTEIIPPDYSWVITNPVWPLEISGITSDTTLYVRLRDPVMSCDSIFAWKIRVDDIQPTGTDTIWFCQNDSINFHGNWYNNDTIITEEFARIGCDSLHRTILIERESLSASIATQNPCTDGTGVIQVEIQSGMPPYDFSLNGGTLQSDPTFSGLDEGSYLIEVIDQNGCRFDTSILLQNGVSIGGVQMDATNPVCDMDNGSIQLYSLTSGMLYSMNGGDYLPDTLYTGLPAGFYRIISRYPGGCLDTIETALFQTGKPQVENSNIDSSHCGHADGGIHIISIAGGSGPYYLQIENSDFDTISQFLDLPGGSYLINIRDSNSCLSDTLMYVPTISGPSVTEVSVTPAVCGLPQGSITVDAIAGSTLVYQLGTQPPVLSPYFTDLLPGAYTLLITDEYGCESEEQIIVPDSFTIHELDMVISPEQCGKQNGSIDFNFPGSAFTISVEEIPGVLFMHNIRNLKAGTYHLAIQDEFLCTLDTVIEIQSVCDIYVPNVFTPNGDGINDTFGPHIPDNFITPGHFEIFDRWGNMVYRCPDLTTCAWDGGTASSPTGQLHPSGVYTWRMVYTDQQGNNRIAKGDVTLIR